MLPLLRMMGCHLSADFSKYAERRSDGWEEEFLSAIRRRRREGEGFLVAIRRTGVFDAWSPPRVAIGGAQVFLARIVCRGVARDAGSSCRTCRQMRRHALGTVASKRRVLASVDVGRER